LRDGNGAVPGEDKLAGPVSRNVNCVDALDISQETPASQAEIQSIRRTRVDAARQHIVALAELFPACFVADKWEPHRPLKVGIKADLIATGLLTPNECRRVLGLYVGRLGYQKAVAAGGMRVDLDGWPAGEVQPDQAEHAAAAVAQMEAKVLAQAEAARIEKAERRRVARQAKQAMPKAPPPDSPAPRRFSLADLKAAAAARRNGGAP
jgi:sRNA-binding protein